MIEEMEGIIEIPSLSYVAELFYLKRVTLMLMLPRFTQFLRSFFVLPKFSSVQ